MTRPTPLPVTLLLAALCLPAPAAEPDLSRVPGVVVDHIPAATKRYVGSPSLAVLPDGTYVASHDIFGPGSRRNRTRVFASADRGKTWRRQTEIQGQWWSTLFVHRGEVYLIGTSKEYGDTVIRRSTDGGKTWTEPTDGASGLLLTGAKYHCAPQPVLVHAGRLWRGMEDAEGPGPWGRHFRSFMMSVPAGADLLNADNWTTTNRIGRDPTWLDGQFGGWLEGNAVATPAGEVVNILRVECPEGGKAAVIRISDNGKTATFDPETGFINFPGGAKKFTIRWDPQSKRYWTLANWIPPRHAKEKRNAGSVRNTLALLASDDLRHWTVRTILLYHPEVGHHGFQYPDWLFDGEDLIAAIRTACDDGLGGAHNAHDANYLTFHRFTGFRDRTMADGALPDTMKE